MAVTRTSIGNEACIHLGVELLTDIDTDTTKRAKVLAALIDNTIDEVLQFTYWGFARKRAQLTADATAPAFGWTYRHALPADYLEMRLIMDHDPATSSTGGTFHPGFEPLSKESIPYQIEGGYILSDVETLYVVYTFQQTDVTTFSPKFIAALALKLAAKACYSLTQDKKLQANLYGLFQKEIEEAASDFSQTESAETVDAAEFTDVRY